MISCHQYDYIEIACMHRLNIELALKNGDSVCGVATDTKRNVNRDECIAVNVNSELQLIVLTTISVLKAREKNPYFDHVNFDVR
ncbi:Rho-binding antiterminator [Pseudoalteromonas carrageenovora]|uniref:Rho-binding antiterminator n=1 Tax=Pseudoalteromonas carrageenovora TaxID=227 RepID=UPI0026E3289B|nr:Rho-binding antiterminator [Pseudoalteromonas carrageenovora]MDO6548708.1 Rho-binding antiterminator [Pseudoalteromonas carrageenovora]MDO6832936.1 Rho-binding antiterminator [Pseudoalteromonas carrageenovora]